MYDFTIILLPTNPNFHLLNHQEHMFVIEFNKLLGLGTSRYYSFTTSFVAPCFEITIYGVFLI